MNTPKTEGEPEAEKTQAPKADSKTDAGVGRSIPPANAEEKPKTQKPEPQKEANDIARRDLAAQESMAQGTSEMADSAWAQVGIGVAALVLLFLTVLYTKRAAEHTEKMLKTAKEGIKDTRINAEKGLRAYVYVEYATIKNLGKTPDIQVKIKNFGQTPAYNMRHWSMAGFQPFPLPFDLPEPDEDIPAPISDLPPGHDHTSPIPYNRTFSNEERESISKGENAIYVSGRITYTDVYDNPRVTNYCLFIGGPVGLKEQMAAYDTGNDSD